MKAFLMKRKYYYVLDRNTDEINKLKEGFLEAAVLEFPSQAPTDKKALLRLEEKDIVVEEKDKITTTLSHQAKISIISHGFYSIKNGKSQVVILDGMRPNLAY